MRLSLTASIASSSYRADVEGFCFRGRRDFAEPENRDFDLPLPCELPAYDLAEVTAKDRPAPTWASVSNAR